MNKKPDELPNAELLSRAEVKHNEYKHQAAALPDIDSDAQRLVHELEVHQIELEMQNEELKQVRVELETALRQYTHLYEFAPVGYLNLSNDGTILKINLKGAKLLGGEQGDLIKRRFGSFLADQSLSAFNSFMRQVFTGQQNKQCEVMLKKNSDDSVWLHIEASRKPECKQGRICHTAIVDITARKETEEKLNYLSSHDMLTGLYNRTFFSAEMARLERGRSFPLSLAVADVDKLKKVNDQHGHPAGDALLKRVAEILTIAFRTEDVIARIGGDEFAVLLPHTDTDVAKALLSRVQQAIQENNSAHADELVSLSIGVSTANEPRLLSAVFKEADEHMYAEKESRKNAS